MKLSSLLKRLLSYLFPLAVEPGEGGEPDDQLDADADTDIEVDDPTPDADDIPADPALEDPAPVRASRREQTDHTEDLRRRLDENERQLAAMRNPVTSQEDRIRAQEDAKLNDPNTTDIEKWQINANRALRESQSQASAALHQARELQDLTTFQAKAIKNPVYAKFSDKVEAKLKEIRGKGQDAPRELVLKVLIGEAVLNGDLKRTGSKPAAPNRGKPTGARSDVPARTSMSDRQKRAARLADRPI